MVYKATVNTETYIGLTGGSFKQRYNGHQSSFRQKHKENETKLSKFIWELKDKGQEPKIQWECVVTAPTYSPNIGRCILCLREKEKILYYKEEATLNSRNEIISNKPDRTLRANSNTILYNTLNYNTLQYITIQYFTIH